MMPGYLMDVVHTCIEEFPDGGESFFDALDAGLRKDSMVEMLMGAVPNLENRTPVLTGKFGKLVAQRIDLGRIKAQGYMLFPGGLRKSPGSGCYVGYATTTMSDRCDHVFIDDSFYSGTTRRVCMSGLGLPKDAAMDSYVLYDGSPIKHPWLWSAYRYHQGSD